MIKEKSLYKDLATKPAIFLVLTGMIFNPTITLAKGSTLTETFTTMQVFCINKERVNISQRTKEICEKYKKLNRERVEATIEGHTKKVQELDNKEIELVAELMNGSTKEERKKVEKLENDRKSKCETNGGSWKLYYTIQFNGMRLGYCVPTYQAQSTQPKPTNPQNTPQTNTPIADELGKQTTTEQHKKNKGDKSEKSNETPKKQIEIMREYLEKSIQNVEKESKGFKQLLENDISRAKEFIAIQDEINQIRYQMLVMQKQSVEDAQKEYKQMLKRLREITEPIEEQRGKRVTGQKYW